jgi:hypothetical protein
MLKGSSLFQMETHGGRPQYFGWPLKKVMIEPWWKWCYGGLTILDISRQARNHGGSRHNE